MGSPPMGRPVPQDVVSGLVTPSASARIISLDVIDYSSNDDIFMKLRVSNGEGIHPPIAYSYAVGAGPRPAA
ncbi:hypothetical protein GCM10027072_34650 [Streptomyces bullii]